MLLYLIRHPRPFAAGGTCYGRKDLEVDAEALAATAASIRSQIPRHELCEAEIFTSPLSRCLALARELAAPREPLIAEDLLELDFGCWEGRRWEALPREELDAWAGDVWGYRPGGGESAAMVARRWRRWSHEIQRFARQTAIAVTHAGFIRVALACNGRWSAAQLANQSVEFGSVHRLDLEESPVAACAAR
jgi:alpha-ribazole phosphatase